MSCLLAEHTPYKGKVKATRRKGPRGGVRPRSRRRESELDNRHIDHSMFSVPCPFASSSGSRHGAPNPLLVLGTELEGGGYCTVQLKIRRHFRTIVGLFY